MQFVFAYVVFGILIIQIYFRKSSQAAHRACSGIRVIFKHRHFQTAFINEELPVCLIKYQLELIWNIFTHGIAKMHLAHMRNSMSLSGTKHACIKNQCFHAAKPINLVANTSRCVFKRPRYIQTSHAGLQIVFQFQIPLPLTYFSLSTPSYPNLQVCIHFSPSSHPYLYRSSRYEQRSRQQRRSRGL